MDKRIQRFSLVFMGSVLCAATLAIASPVNSDFPDRPPASSVFGFTSGESIGERSVEQQFDRGLDPADLDVWLKSLASAPNQVGSPHDRRNAEFVRDQLQQWGWDAQIEMFYPLYPTPLHHLLELVAPTKFVASLREPPVAGDETSRQTDGLPPYNVYGADGDVTADLVYLNYGMPQDYKDLQRRGIDVRGKIVITRYGEGWRGLKPKLAQEHGALGCIIYSDPEGDGYSRGDVYPKGGWRPPEGVQRGSVEDMTLYPGDPLTPGVGATKNAKRLPISEAKTILKIPVIPISYADAQPLLAALAGPVAPKHWRGALPITYHIGPGPARVHLAISSDWSKKPLYDVIARIPGSQSPDEWVVRGNHRDGWVFGAWDPLAGHVAMMAEAKAFGALLKSGWRPKRTLVYASWDGEEPGLLGSTEWAETHAAELERKAVLYLNSDTNARGFLSLGGSHSLQHLADEVALSVKDPETGVDVGTRLRARMMVEGHEQASSEREQRDAAIAMSGADLPIAALGSGSDFSAFLQHLGIATLAVEYGGEDDDAGIYHSDYDSYDHYVRFGDPGFHYGIAEAQTVGHFVLRMADADVLPLQFAGFSQAVENYVGELHRLEDKKRKDAQDLAVLLERHVYALTADPTRPVGPPEALPEVPYLNLAPLDNIVVRLKKVAGAYDAAYAKLLSGEVRLDDVQRTRLDALLQGMEQTLLDPRGLPGREWYRHLIYAPGMYTGYGVKTLPGVREAIEENRWEEANRYSGMTAAVLANYCDRLEQATALLTHGG